MLERECESEFRLLTTYTSIVFPFFFFFCSEYIDRILILLLKIRKIKREKSAYVGTVVLVTFLIEAKS